MMIEGRVLKPKDKIYDLVDVLGGGSFSAIPAQGSAGKGTAREKIYDLVDVVEKRPRMALVDAGLRDEIMKRASEIAEQIARDVIPSVAERVIREEAEQSTRDVIPSVAERVIREEAEKIARDVIPSVAERVIREEIEKLKRDA